MSDYDKLAEAINKAWLSNYTGEPTQDSQALANRVKLIAEDRACMAYNYRVTNEAYVKADNELRELKERTARPEAAQFKSGDRVLVAWDSGHLEECTVDAVTIWVRDSTGHSYERSLGQVSRINDPSLPQSDRSK
jgi:hypothetical protein